MRYDPDKHHRRSIRLKGYDYTLPGAYFITLCVQERQCLLGEIQESALLATEAGRMVERWWKDLAERFPSLTLDEFIVMPNHLHGIFFLRATPNRAENPTVAALMDWFKTMTTNEYIRGVKTLGWRNFPRKLWQRGYYEHMIRDQKELESIREYIRQNPARWLWDQENPAAIAPEPAKPRTDP